MKCMLMIRVDLFNLDSCDLVDQRSQPMLPRVIMLRLKRHDQYQIGAHVGLTPAFGKSAIRLFTAVVNSQISNNTQALVPQTFSAALKL